jgi:Ca2+/H+ antiporter, TMEM165/GDT1 family
VTRRIGATSNQNIFCGLDKDLEPTMEAVLVSLGIGTLSEIGDKTQMLAVVLAAKFRKPTPIILGVVLASAGSHTIGVVFGGWLSRAVSPAALRWSLGLSFLAMALWTVMLKKGDEFTQTEARFGVFATTLVSYMMLDIGDKTQISTLMLAARYPSSLAAVLLGTTCGAVLADTPAVLFGKVVAGSVSLRVVRTLAASIFLVIGLSILIDFDAVAGYV